MIRLSARPVSLLFALALFEASDGIGASAQDVAVNRLAPSSDMTIRLENLASHETFERSGDAYFVVPAGRYAIQLVRAGQVVYQEAEYLGPDAVPSRTINAKNMQLSAGVPNGSPPYEADLCSALVAATRQTVGSFGLHEGDVQRRLANADFHWDSARCTSTTFLEGLMAVLGGSYGVTPLGMVTVSMEFTPLAAPHNRFGRIGNSPVYNDPATQRLAIPEQPGSNMTPSLISDLKVGIVDLAVGSGGAPLLTCGAINASTPVFCDANGLAVATPAISRAQGLYRLHVRTGPVDEHGVELDHWVSFVSEDEYRTTQERLTAESAAIRTRLQQRIEHLHTPEGSARGSGGDSHQADLSLLRDMTWGEIDLALHASELQPLRQHYAEAEAHHRVPVPAAQPQSEATALLRELRSETDSLARVSGELGVDLVFRTSPVESEGARLTFSKCDRCIPIISQGGEHRFYRGRYLVRATQEGYAPWEGWLDLVSEPKTILQCEMVRLRRGQSEQTSSCSLVAQ